MDFFKSVFAEDPETSDTEEEKKLVSGSPRNSSEIEEEEEEQNEEGEEEEVDRRSPSEEADQSSRNSESAVVGGGWSFGGFIKTFATKSESVLQTYRRDLEEFSSGLKKETVAIRQVASRAVKELPASLEAGASVAQESLESVGQAIDDIGSTVWRGTTEIISHGKEALLSADPENDSSDSQAFTSSSVISKRYSRFESQILAIQSDPNTYCEDPEDLDDFHKWKSEFVLAEKDKEIKNLLGESGVMEDVYTKLVPSTVDHETFWTRYFNRIHRLKQAEDARANLVKRAISGDEDEDLSWDVDDDEEESNAPLKRSDSSEKNELEKKHVEESQAGSSSEVVAEMGDKSSTREIQNEELVAESISGNETDEKVSSDEKSDLSVSNSNDSVEKSEEKFLGEGKSEPAESGKDSDFSIVSSQPSLPEEEDLGWDEIEDLSIIDGKKVVVGGSPNKADLRKRLSAADEEEDLSWDIEDDDEPVKS